LTDPFVQDGRGSMRVAPVVVAGYGQGRTGGTHMLELQNMTGGYGSTTVLRDVSLTVPDGTVVALLGPNGAGKSTTLKMASGLLRPDQGKVILNGQDVTKWSANRRARSGMCHIFEGRSIFPSLTVRENLLMQTPRGTSESEVLEQAADAFPPLASRRRQIAGTLSGGEQQMLALVRAYVSGAQTVLVDEASLGLAPLVVDKIFAFLERIAASGVSLLIVEQYVTRALALAKTVSLLSQGSVVYEGPAEGLSEEYIFALYSGEALPEPAA
jgi:branched-chain amino acid transport system ATP-binding protein